MILLQFCISLRRALALMDLSSSMYYYQQKRNDEPALRLMSDYAQDNPTHGQDMMAKVFHRDHGWNYKKTLRLYRVLKLAKVRRKRLRRLMSPKETLLQPLAPNECWSMDFMSDSLMNGNKVRVLNVIDDYNREYLGYDVARSLPSQRVTRDLDNLIDYHGKPSSIRIDNGPEYRSHHMQQWAKDNDIKLLFIQPGKPTQNSYIERFNRTFRTEVLNAFLFMNVQELIQATEEFQYKYNHLRPHGALNDLPPIEFKQLRKALKQEPITIKTNNKQSKGENT